MTSQAKLQQFVHTTLGPETLRRRPKVARRLAARKLAHPPSQQAWLAQTEAGMLVNPLGRPTPHHPTHPGPAGHR